MKKTISSEEAKKIKIKKWDVLKVAKQNGIKLIGEKDVDRKDPNLFPISDFKDIVVFLGSGASAIINKDVNFIKLAKQGFDAYVGYDKAIPQFLDMTQDEFLSVYEDFEAQFKIDNDPELQKFVIDRFMTAISEAKAIILFAMSRKEDEPEK
jgi:hypothetical protein